MRSAEANQTQTNKLGEAERPLHPQRESRETSGQSTEENKTQTAAQAWGQPNRIARHTIRSAEANQTQKQN